MGSVFSLLKNVGFPKSITLCPMKSIIGICTTAVTMSMAFPNENVDGRPVPALFRDRPTDYHMFLISTLFAFISAFSALLIQHKPRVERCCRIIAIASMLSALTIVLFATALWFLGPLLDYHVGQLPLGLSNWKAAIVIRDLIVLAQWRSSF